MSDKLVQVNHSATKLAVLTTAQSATNGVNVAEILQEIAALLPAALGLYTDLKAEFSGPVQSIEQVLSAADADWATVKKIAEDPKS